MTAHIDEDTDGHCETLDTARTKKPTSDGGWHTRTDTLTRTMQREKKKINKSTLILAGALLSARLP